MTEFDARCPRCDAALEIRTGARLRFPHPLSCEACGHEPVLKVDREDLERRSEGRG